MNKKELKTKPKTSKKSLIRPKNESNRLKMIVTVVILLIVAIAYYLIDSGSYIATVDKNRISKFEYQFFLSQQQSATEQKEGLFNKTADEKKAYWTKTADGQNPWETAKRDALDNSKDYLIQLIKAQEMGLRIDADIKNEISSLIASLQGELTDKQFSEQIRYAYKISTDEFNKVTANFMLIDEFKAAYLSKQYTPVTITDKELQASYESDTKKFDLVDIRYAVMNKFDEKGEKLDQAQLDIKKKAAEEALSKIKKGEDIDKVIAEYSEEKATETSTEPVGKASISYSEATSIQNLIEWVFANKIGDASVIDTDGAIYVIRIEKRTTFEDVKTTIKSTMENAAKETFYDNALQTWSLEAQYNIIKNDRVYDAISYK